MVDYRTGSHAIYDIKYHFVWITKYRYHILKGKIGGRLRELIRQGCEARGIVIVKGSVNPDHVHLLVSCPPHLSPSKIIQYLKGRSSRLIQEEFPELKKRYWDQHLWARGYFCGTVGTVTDEMIQQYLEHHQEPSKEVFKVNE